MTPIPEANQNPRESGDTAPRALRLVHWIPASAGEQGFLTAVLVKLAAKAPNHVWLGAAPLYRGDDARRLARLARTEAEWRKALGALEIEAPAPMRTNLYTALYHSLLDRKSTRLNSSH